jgi:hypothetical protein
MTLENTPLASREWRLQNLYTIRDAHGVLGPFTPNIAQREFYNRLWYCNHVLKARKLGFSTFIEILFLDDLLFAGPLRAGIIDYTIEDAQTKLGMMRLAYEYLDSPHIHPELIPDPDPDPGTYHVMAAAGRLRHLLDYARTNHVRAITYQRRASQSLKIFRIA